MRKKNVRIRLKTLEPTTEPATSKQTGYIIGLLKQKNIKLQYSDSMNHLLSKKQASKFINALLEGNPIKIFNLDEYNRKKGIKKRSNERVKNIKLESKIAERKKIDAILNAPVKKIEWLPPKPKNNDPVRRISFEEQQAKLNNM